MGLEKTNREVDGGFPLEGRRVTMGQGVPARMESWVLQRVVQMMGRGKDLDIT